MSSREIHRPLFRTFLYRSFFAHISSMLLDEKHCGHNSISYFAVVCVTKPRTLLICSGARRYCVFFSCLLRPLKRTHAHRILRPYLFGPAFLSRPLNHHSNCVITWRGVVIYVPQTVNVFNAQIVVPSSRRQRKAPAADRRQQRQNRSLAAGRRTSNLRR